MSENITREIRINKIIGTNFYCTVEIDDINFGTGLEGLIKFIEGTNKHEPGIIERECKFWWNGYPMEPAEAIQKLYEIHHS